jgi:hypothetical protein
MVVSEPLQACPPYVDRERSGSIQLAVMRLLARSPDETDSVRTSTAVLGRPRPIGKGPLLQDHGQANPLRLTMISMHHLGGKTRERISPRHRHVY